MPPPVETTSESLLIAMITFGATILVAVAGWGLATVHEDQMRETALLQAISAQVGGRQRGPVSAVPAATPVALAHAST